MISDYVVLDVESTGLNPCYGARITCICAKTSSGEWFKEANEDEALLLRNFFTWLNGKGKATLVTANGRDFDVPFIVIRASLLGLGNVSYANLLSMEHFDIQTITSRKHSVNDMATIAFGEQKWTDGKAAILFFAERQFDKLIKYCVSDVELEEKLYLHIMKNKESKKQAVAV